MQRIVIKNFGPIKDVDIPIHDFMIFIGPQASGKSTIAKAIYFFMNNLTGSIFTSLLNLKKHDNLEACSQKIFDNALDKFHSAWKYYPTGVHEIQFFYSDENWVKLKLRKVDEVDYDEGIEFSKKFRKALEGVIQSIQEINAQLEDANSLKITYPGIIRIVREFINNEFGVSATTFIPAGRSVFSILANQIQLFEGDRVDETIKDFANQINDIRGKQYPTRGLEQSTDSNVQLAMNLYRKILKGSYIYDRQQDKIQLQDGVDIVLEKASSGQQESIWPVLILFNLIRENSSNFLVFEEPEAHLYPEAQKYITELISLCVNQSKNKMIVTTHSPYILGAVNNLIYANNVGKKHPTDAAKLVNKNLWLDYDRVMAYFVDEGKVRPIMDEEMRMINNSEIDSASGIINEEFDSLFKLAYSE